MKIDALVVIIYAFLVVFIVFSLVAGNIETERWCAKGGMSVKYENFIAACVTASPANDR